MVSGLPGNLVIEILEIRFGKETLNLIKEKKILRSELDSCDGNVIKFFSIPTSKL